MKFEISTIDIAKTGEATVKLLVVGNPPSKTFLSRLNQTDTYYLTNNRFEPRTHLIMFMSVLPTINKLDHYFFTKKEATS